MVGGVTEDHVFRRGLACSTGWIGIEVAQVQSWFAGQKHSSLLQVLLLTLTFEALAFFRSTVKLEKIK